MEKQPFIKMMLGRIYFVFHLTILFLGNNHYYYFFFQISESQFLVLKKLYHILSILRHSFRYQPGYFIWWQHFYFLKLYYLDLFYNKWQSSIMKIFSLCKFLYNILTSLGMIYVLHWLQFTYFIGNFCVKE